MSDNSKTLAYEYEYEFDDHETCIRAGVAIECMIHLLCDLEASLPERMQFDADGNTLYIRTSTEEHIMFDKFIDVFFEINSRFIEE